MDILLKMSHFFAFVQMRALDDMVWEYRKRIQTIWEEIIGEHGQASIVEIRKYLKV